MDKPERPQSTARWQQAEVRRQEQETVPEELTGAEARALIQELQVHQIELEMQNDELRRTQAKLEESLAQYADLYDFVPIGLLTLDEQGKILEANLRAARQLGVERDELSHRFFCAYLPRDWQIWHLHLRQVFREKKLQTCELKVRSNEGAEFQARLDSVYHQDSGGINICRTALADITATKQAEEACRAREAMLGSIFRAAPIGFGVVRDRIIVQANDLLGRMTGYSPQELLGQPARLLYATQEDFDYVGREKYRQIAERGTGSVETRWQRRDGSIIHVLLSSAPLAAGDPAAGVTFTAQDITQEKQTVAALRQSEERFRSIYRNSMDGILLTVPDGGVLSANPSACRLLGYTEEEIVGQGRKGLVDEDDPELPRLLAERRSAGKCRGELTFIRKDGTKLLTELSSELFQDEYGRTLNILVLRDITQRKNIELALAKSEEKYRQLVENANSIIVKTDPKGNITFCNSFARQFFGYQAGELQGRNVIGTITPEVDSQGRDLAKMVADILARPVDYLSNENENMLKNGERVWIAWNHRVIRNDQGQMEAILGFGTDITARKRAEEAMREGEKKIQLQSELLQEANAALKALLRQREEDRAELEQAVTANVKELILPYLEKLKKSRPTEHQQLYLDILESHLYEVTSPFLSRITAQTLLTPGERRVSELIRQGKTSKEIAVILGASESAVLFHRKGIRRKLGLQSKKINLISYLNSLKEW